MLYNLLPFHNDHLSVHGTNELLDIMYLNLQKKFDKVLHNKLMFMVKQLGIAENVHN